MKKLYKHVHIVVDDKREYIDGSILINNGTIEDVFVQSNKTFDDVEEINMQGKIFIPSFFDTKSKTNKQRGVTKRYIASEEVLEIPTHLITDDEITNRKNILALTRIKSINKAKRIKTFFNPMSEGDISADGVSDISEALFLPFNSNKMINRAFFNDCMVEFGIDKKINDEHILFVLKNIDVNKLLLISYKHDDIGEQIKRLIKLNVSLTDIVAMTSINAYNFYGNTRQDGYLIKGKPANIVCLDENMDIEFTLIEGEKDA